MLRGSFTSRSKSASCFKHAPGEDVVKRKKKLNKNSNIVGAKNDLKVKAALVVIGI